MEPGIGNLDQTPLSGHYPLFGPKLARKCLKWFVTDCYSKKLVCTWANINHPSCRIAVHVAENMQIARFCWRQSILYPYKQADWPPQQDSASKPEHFNAGGMEMMVVWSLPTAPWPHPLLPPDHQCLPSPTGKM
jgi:hypothetical protein